jgi:hypothetical protein
LGWETTKVQRETFASIPKGEYDFGLVAQWGGYPENIIQLMRDAGAKTVIYWAFDYHDINPHEWHYRMAREADIFLSKEMAHRDKYKDANFHWLPQDFAPDFLDKLEIPVVQDIDVLFTGSYLAHATERIQDLLAVQEKFNLVVHSVTPDQWTTNGIKDSRGPIMDDGLRALYAHSCVILSIDHFISEGYWSDRNAQVMVCGGMVLFRYVPMSESTFGQNVAYYHNREELLEMVEFYLTHQADREHLARKGYEFAKNNLRCTNRVAEMLEIWRDYESHRNL